MSYRRTNQSIALLCLCALLSGCASEESNPTAPEDDVESGLFVRAVLPAEADVQGLVIEVTAPDIGDRLLFEIRVDPDSHEASGMIRVPAGSSRTVTARAFNSSGIQTHEGSAVIDVLPEGSDLDLTLLPVEGTVSVDLSIGNFEIELSRTSGTVLREHQLQLHAVVTKPDGVSVEDPVVTWASSNPTLASVDDDGLVTGLLPGEVEIVASVHGASASAKVDVITSMVAYVTDRTGNRVVPVDVGKPDELSLAASPVGVGSEPFSVAITPDGAFAYVVNYLSGTVSVVDVASNRVTATIPVGPNPISVAIAPDGALAYVGNYLSGTVSVVDLASNRVTATVPVGPNPFSVAITPDGAFAYVANYFSGTVSVVDLASNRVTVTIPTGSQPISVAITPNGALAYVADYSGGTISVVDVASNRVTTTIPVGSRPRSVAVTPDGARAYVVNNESNNVSVIDVGSSSVVATLPGGNLPISVAITPDGAFAVVAHYNGVRRINVQNNSYVDLGIGGGGWSVAIAPIR